MFFNTPEEGNDSNGKFEAVAKGRHRFIVLDSDYTPNKNDTGKVLKVVSEVMDGPSKGNRLFEFFNLEHKSSKAQQIGRGEFKRFLLCLGIEDPLRDVQECHRKIAHKTFWAEIDHENGYAVAKEYFQDQSTAASPSKTQPTGSSGDRNDLDSIPF